MTRLIVAALGISLALASKTAFALVCTSTGATWNVAGNWSCARVPTVADSVIINTNLTVNVATANVLSVTVNAGFTLTQSSALQTAGALTIATTAIVNSSANMTVTGATNLNGSGTLNVTAGATHTHTGTVTINGTWNNSGNTAVTFGANFANNSTFTSGSGTQTFTAATATLSGTAALTTFSGGLTANGLTVNTGLAGRAVTASGVTAVGGILTVTSGTLNLGANATVTGTTSVTGTLNITGGATHTHTGTVTINAGGTWNNSGNTPVSLGGNLTQNATGTFTSGTGTLTFTAATATLGGAPITFDGNVTANNITIAANIVISNNKAATITGNLVGGNAASTWTNAPAVNNVSLSVTGTVMTIGILNASCTAPNVTTVNYSGAAQTVKVPSGAPATYCSLTFSGSGAKTMPATAMTISNDFSLSGTVTATAAQALTIGGNVGIGAGTTFTTGAFNHSVAGNFTRTGTFTASAGSTIVFNGSSVTAQTLSGSTTFTNLTINNTGGGVTLSTLVASDVTLGAAGLLTLTNGTITTNAANTVITPRACNAPSVARTNGFVAGNLQKAIPANASTCTYEVGSGTSYTPAVLAFVVGTGAGNIRASTTGTDHLSIASSGIDSTKSVNRFWTLTNGAAPLVTLPAAGFSATFNYINGSPVDFDLGATPANFVVERWDGANWLPTTLNAGCTATPGTNLCEQVNGLTATMFGDFAIGEPQPGFNSNPGAFNAFETTASTTQILGRIFTKLAGTSFTLSIVAVSNNARNAAPSTNQLTVEIINSSGTPGAFSAATNCWSGWTSVQSQTVGAPVGWISGRVDVPVNAPTQAVRDARIRVTQAGTGLIGCSIDRFTVRPAAFTISSTANNNGSGAGTTIKTGANFSITAQPVRSDLVTSISLGYDGTPSINNSNVVGSPNAGTIGGSFSAASGGAATGSSFFYSEVGNFGVNANAVFDSSFTSVDQSSDCTPDFSNSLVGGKYGCSFGSIAVAQTTGSSGFGRFIPDNFAVSFNAPQFSSSCGTFSYVGQAFTYSTAPAITVTARNGTSNGLTNAKTTNYAGVYMKLTNASLAAAPYNTQAGRYSRFDALGGGATPGLVTTTTGFPDTTTDPVIAFPAASGTSGVGTLTFGTGTAGLLFNRSSTTPNAPFNADIALTLNVVDSDNVAYAGNPASFGAAIAGNGVAFSGGNNAIRYGRVRILNGAGPTSVDIPVTLSAEYYASAATGFTTNTTDTCTSFVPKNFVLFGHQGSITPANMVSPTAGSNGNVSIPAGLTLGVANLKLLKPTGSVTTPGSVKVCLDVDSAAGVGDTTCQAATPANQSYLQGPWTGSTYDKDPPAQVNFGLYGAQPRNFIFFRENY